MRIIASQSKQSAMGSLIANRFAASLGLIPTLAMIVAVAGPVLAEEGLERLGQEPSEMASSQGIAPGGGLSLVESKNQLIVLSDNGVDQSNLRMRVADSALFLLNKTSDSLLTIEIDFGKKTTHCASTNLTIDDDNVIRSSKPFPPRDFASVCFHDPGQYPYKIYGLRGHPQGLSGTITVE